MEKSVICQQKGQHNIGGWLYVTRTPLSGQHNEGMKMVFLQDVKQFPPSEA
mgnify:CR=1 FL=1